MEIFDDRDLQLGTMRLPHPSMEALIERLAPRNGVIRLAAEAEGEFAGILEMETFPGVPRHNHVGEIHLIATHPKFRGKGAGRALMEAAIDMADKWLRLTRLGLIV